jgi:molybdopterin biosynthesis enzyme MoaB
VAAGEREDGSGDQLEELLTADGFDVVRRVVRDEREEIFRAICDLSE